jgi:hypothetical protein
MLKKTLYRACDFSLRRSSMSHFVTCSFLNFGLEKSRIVLQLWVRRSPGQVRRSSGVSALAYWKAGPGLIPTRHPSLQGTSCDPAKKLQLRRDEKREVLYCNFINCDLINTCSALPVRSHTSVKKTIKKEQFCWRLFNTIQYLCQSPPTPPPPQQTPKVKQQGPPNAHQI